MKQIYLLLSLTLFTTINTLSADWYQGSNESLYEPVEDCNLVPFNYIRFGIAKVTPNSKSHIGPTLAIGRRYELKEAAIDLSVNWLYGEGAEGDSDHFYLSIPRALFVKYLTPREEESVYYGLGASWGYQERNGGRKKFHGLCLEGSLGYEFRRTSPLRLLTELTLSQPAVAIKHKGSLPGPIISLSIGMGF